MSGWHKPAPHHERRVERYLLGDQPSKPLFRPVWHMKAAAPTCQRQRSYKAVAVPVLKAALHPSLAVGNTTASICQQFDVAKRGLIRGVKWHVSPRRSHCLNDATRSAKRNKITSQRRDTPAPCREPSAPRMKKWPSSSCRSPSYRSTLTLVELDADYRRLAERLGVPGYFRVPTQRRRSAATAH